MRAPDHRSFREIITEFLKRYELNESEPLGAFFVRLRDDPNRRIDKIWKKIVDSNPSMNTASEREIFLKCLTDPWDCAVMADGLAWVEPVTRATIRAEKTKIRKTLVSTSLKTLLASEAFQRIAKIEEAFEDLRRNRLHPVLSIRSNHAGSRTRTAFMRVASRNMRRATKKWCDDEVAALTDIAFPDYETTVDMVRSARRGMRP